MLFYKEHSKKLYNFALLAWPRNITHPGADAGAGDEPDPVQGQGQRLAPRVGAAFCRNCLCRNVVNKVGAGILAEHWNLCALIYLLLAIYCCRSRIPSTIAPRGTDRDGASGGHRGKERRWNLWCDCGLRQEPGHTYWACPGFGSAPAPSSLLSF